jgi:hypothetical protein
VYIQVAFFGGINKVPMVSSLCHLDSRSLETIYGNMFNQRIPSFTQFEVETIQSLKIAMAVHPHANYKSIRQLC